MAANEVIAKQALREVRLLRHLGRHSNVCTRVLKHHWGAFHWGELLTLHDVLSLAGG